MTEITDYYALSFKPVPCNLQDDFNRLNDYIIKEFGSWENYRKESILISEEFVKNFNPDDWFMIFGEECNGFKK